jgi:DNA-binding PadR family transcriptional regulator
MCAGAPDFAVRCRSPVHRRVPVLRRAVQVTKADEWAGVGAGSLHRELRKLADDELIAAVRVERVDRRPERTIYQITASGRSELDTLREQAIGSCTARPTRWPQG